MKRKGAGREIFRSTLTFYVSNSFIRIIGAAFNRYSNVHPGRKGITRLTVARTGQDRQVQELHSIDTVRANLEAFADAVEGRAPYPFTRAEKLGNVAVMEAIIESARTGQPVTL